MPVVRKKLVKLANRSDAGRGMCRWRVDGIDDEGNRWTHVFAGPLTRAKAKAIMDTLWLDEETEQV